MIYFNDKHAQCPSYITQNAWSYNHSNLQKLSHWTIWCWIGTKNLGQGLWEKDSPWLLLISNSIEKHLGQPLLCTTVDVALIMFMSYLTFLSNSLNCDSSCKEKVISLLCVVWLFYTETVSMLLLNMISACMLCYNQLWTKQFNQF